MDQPKQGGYQYPAGSYPQATYPQGAYPQEAYPPGAYPQPGYPHAGYTPPTGYPTQTAYPPGTAGVAFAPQPPPSGYQPPGSLGEDGGTTAFDFSDMTIRKAFIRKVYSILMCQLLVTMSFISLFVFHEPTRHWVQEQPLLFIIAFVVLVVCTIVMACCDDLRRQVPLNFIFLALFTIAQSFLLGVISSVYEINEVMMAVGITAAVCLALTLFAFQTKWDFTVMGGFLVCAAVVLLMFGLLTISMPAYSTMQLMYACIGALLFSLFLICDTQLMLGGKRKYVLSPEEYIFAALNLYIDITKIFIYILRIIALSRS